jgi:hypothetical protein
MKSYKDCSVCPTIRGNRFPSRPGGSEKFSSDPPPDPFLLVDLDSSMIALRSSPTPVHAIVRPHWPVSHHRARARSVMKRTGRDNERGLGGRERGALIVHAVAALIFSTTAFLAGETVIGLASMALTGSAIALSSIVLPRAL